jgi:hypothetical protein
MQVLNAMVMPRAWLAHLTRSNSINVAGLRNSDLCKVREGDEFYVLANGELPEIALDADYRRFT